MSPVTLPVVINLEEGETSILVHILLTSTKLTVPETVILSPLKGQSGVFPVTFILTLFNEPFADKTAGVSKPLKGISAEKCAKCTVDAMEKRADVTIVGTKMKLAVLLSKLLSENTVLKLQYKIQGSKLK